MVSVLNGNWLAEVNGTRLKSLQFAISAKKYSSGCKTIEIGQYLKFLYNSVTSRISYNSKNHNISRKINACKIKLYFALIKQDGSVMRSKSFIEPWEVNLRIKFLPQCTCITILLIYIYCSSNFLDRMFHIYGARREVGELSPVLMDQKDSRISSALG